MSSNSLEELVPHSLDLRLCDPKALDALSRAASAFDREALGRICQVVRQRVLEPEFRVGVGRMDDDGWTLTAERVAAMFEERLRSGEEQSEDLEEKLLQVLPNLQAVYAMPFFQADYALRARMPPDRVSRLRRVSRGARARAASHRGASRPGRSEAPPVRGRDVGRIDRVALGVVGRRARARAPPAAAPVFEQVQLLADEANLRGHDIAINGWYGPSTTSDLTPVAWERRA